MSWRYVDADPLILGMWGSQFDVLSNRKEFLVVWGLLNKEEDLCNVLILDPDQKETKTSVIGEPSCNYFDNVKLGSGEPLWVK